MPEKFSYRTEGLTPEQLAVIQKYERNIANAREQAAQGKLAEFLGFPPDHFDGISLRAFFTQETLEEILQRISDPIEKAASETGMLIYPLRLVLPHMTISDLRWKPDSGISRDEQFAHVAADPRAAEAAAPFAGQEVVFDTLWGGQNMVAAASRIPEFILNARRLMSAVEESNGMGHKDLTNIAHFTAGRFAGVDPQAENPDMNAFGERLMELDQLLRGNPLVARIQSAGIMTNEQMQRYHEAGIMEALELRKAQRG